VKHALDPDRLLDEACAEADLGDFAGDELRLGLERLTESLRAEARLHDLGVEVAASELRAYLVDRLRVVAYRREHPDLAAIPVESPVVIVGQGRTGTTILFDILAQDPNLRAPLTWQVDAPLPPPTPETADEDPRIAAVDEQLAMVDLVLPEFRSMHPMGARLAQECVRITAADFRSMIFPTQYRVPSYTRWLLDEADMTSAYRWHRAFLQHLAAQWPTPRWLLKSPGHIWSLDALMAEYPGALLVQTHRDPIRIIASLGSLTATLRRLGTDETSIAECAAEFADYIVDGIDRSVDARADGVVPADQVVDVQFADFMAEPFAAIATIYDRFGLELTADSEARMRSFLADHGQDEGGGHRYTFADTGLDEGALRERTRRYQEHFGVPDEPVP
jgi:hypothetical protein